MEINEKGCYCKEISMLYCYYLPATMMDENPKIPRFNIMHKPSSQNFWFRKVKFDQNMK